MVVYLSIAPGTVTWRALWIPFWDQGKLRKELSYTSGLTHCT